MNDLIPAILAHDETAFYQQLQLAETLSPIVQIDVMDGRFVPNVSWYEPEKLSLISTPARFELHLMVSRPDSYIETALRARASIQRIVWHIEVPAEHQAWLKRCAQLGFESGLALAPQTPIEQLAPHADAVDEILVLGVEPGLSGQSLIPATIDKARRIHARWPKLHLAFDGGINATTIVQLKRAGVERFCVASAIFKAKNPSLEFKKLQMLV